MKKIITLLVLNIFLLSGLMAAGIPQGMKYQAVARDAKGEIIADQEIYLKISLFTNDVQQHVHYSETHKVKTNALGLFSIVIGEGFSEYGLFDAIPWITDEIWMEVSMSNKESVGFTSISKSKLLAVPYAFAAGHVIGQDQAPGNPSVSRYKITYCPCKDGLQILQVLYLGPSNVTVKVYRNSNLTELVNTFTSVQNGDILPLNASGMNDGKFKDVTYMQLIAPAGTTVTKMNTKCTDYDEDLNSPVSGETFGNFSILSQTDKTGQVCTACEMKPDWKVGGNALYDACNLLGSVSNSDVVIITNNTERMKIMKTGDITIANSLSIGNSLDVANNAEIENDLTVHYNANFNTLGGATTIYGPLTVGNVSPSILTGSLRVDQQTNLNNGLFVNNVKPTVLTGTLRVDNATDLYNSFTVNNASPTVLSGTLEGYLDVTLREKLRLTNATHNSFTTSDGALVVAGGVGIGRNLNVGGNSTFGGSTSFAGPIVGTDLTPSTSCTTGALVIAGGAGISKELQVCGLTKLGSTLNVTGATSLADTLKVSGATTLNSTLGVMGGTSLNSFLAVTGATTLNNTLSVAQATTLSSTLQVAGITNLSNKLNVAQKTTLSDALQVNGQVTITKDPGGSGELDYASYPLQVEGGSQGIAVKVNGSRSISNNFISFWDANTNHSWGRIEGQNLADLSNDDDYKHERACMIYDVTSGVIDVLFATNEVIMATSEVLSSVSSSTACVGFGACVTTPIPSWIVGATAQLVVAIAQEIVVIADVVFSSVNLGIYDNSKDANIGVSYQSGNGDYAEYLLRADLNEELSYGDVVGVIGGKVSKNTEQAHKIMVVSNKPIVLGNMPQPDREADYEKVAFMGQVPVKVFGAVNIGDYIIPSGNNDGIGIAVAPSKISLKDIRNIIGTAWSGSGEKFGLNMINVAVGLNNNDDNRIVEEMDRKLAAQQEDINALRVQISETNNLLAQLVPGFTPPSSTFVDNSSSLSKPSLQSQNASQPSVTGNVVTPTAKDIVYYELTNDDIEKAIEYAKLIMIDRGVDIETHAFWKKYREEPGYKDQLIAKVKSSYDKALSRQKALDARY
jgi:hypothetical protein